MKSFSRRWLSGPVTLGVLSAAFLCVAHAGVIVDLGTLDLELGPDGRITRQLEVTNTDDKPAAISVFVADWKQDENGAVEAVDPSTAKSPESATGWIGVSPQRFVLGKREKKIVTVSFVMPKYAALMPLKEYRSMVFTETSDTQSQTTAPGRELRIRVIGRIGTKIFIRNPQGLAKLDCEVTKVAEATREGKRGLEIHTSNRGNVHIQSDASKIALRDQAGATVETLPISPFSILPGHERTVFVELPEPGTSKLEKGKTYNALAVIDYGGSDLVAGELEFID
jgi:P pilus assembly chaperone PapD